MYTCSILPSLAPIIIRTARPTDLAEFYREALGIEQLRSDAGRHIGLNVGSIYLVFDRISEEESEEQGPTYLWFAVEDLSETYERFVALGSTVGSPPMRLLQGDLTASILDPEGNVVCLAQRRNGRAGHSLPTRIERMAATSLA